MENGENKKIKISFIYHEPILKAQQSARNLKWKMKDYFTKLNWNKDSTHISWLGFFGEGHKFGNAIHHKLEEDQSK